jgi:acyl-CoA reductase-like NAD-dependent aldehyde dehydrogenase
LSSQPGRGTPVIVIHSLAHAVAALSAAADTDRAIVLASPPDAGIYAGPGWFREVIRAAREAMPAAQFGALIDCGDDAGAAMAAIRAGLDAIVFTGRADVAARLADIAAQGGARLITQRPAAPHDLGAVFFSDHDTLRRRCAEILASTAAFC